MNLSVFNTIFIIAYVLSVVATALIVWILMDKTVISKKNKELLEAKKEAKKAKLAKDRFLANMSGEIRTPINTIVGLNQMIMREDTTKVPEGYLRAVKNHSEGIKDASESLRSLVDNLLDMSAIESGKMYLSEQEYDTMDFIQFVIGQVKKSCTEKELILDATLDEMLPSKLYGDISKIKQIILNLLTNAVKYTDEGTISFNVSMDSREGDYCDLKISVKDTGIGIRKEDIDKLFNAYSQYEGSVDEEVSRVGLGLDVSRRFAEFLGGEIICNSVYGEGSEFIFTIKQRIIDPSPAGTSVEVGDDYIMDDYMSDDYDYEPLFVSPDADILLLDDNRDSINIFTGLLKATRVFITTASDADECIKLIKGTRFNMIFIDLMVQNIEVENLISKIKDMDDNLPVYVISSDEGKGEAYYKSLGYEGWILKPIDGDDLEEIINNHLPADIKEMALGEE